MKAFRLLAAVPLLIAASAFAQTGAEIVVTGRGLPDPTGDRAFDVVTIERARIEQSQRLESVLADVAGLQQFRRSDSRSANPTSQGVTLRGLGGNAASRALLILDGVPQSDPFGGWVAFPAYATDRLARVRVTRGGGGGGFGPGALAGTQEVGSAGAGGLAGSIAHGSRDSLDARASASLTRGGGFATIAGAFARGDGFVPVVAEDRGPVDRPAPYRQASGAVRAAVALAPRTELQTSVSAFTDQRERGTPFTANTSEGADASLRVVGRGRWNWSALAYLQTRAFAASFAAINATRTTASQTLNQYNTPATGTGARLEIAPPLGRGLALRLGADLRRVSGRTQELFTFLNGAPTRRRVAGGRNDTAGVFADGSAERGRFTLALGGRVDRWRIADGFLDERAIAGTTLTDLAFAERHGTEATGRAGLAWRPLDAVTLRTAVYRGWRLPTLNELYRPFRVGADATAANAALSPERLTGIEGGVTVAPLPGFSLAATVFDNRLRGAIANVSAGSGPGVFPLVGFVAAGGTYRIRRNLHAVRSRGIELDAAWQSGPVGLRASWSRVDARVIDAGALDGLRPAQTPRDQVSATADLSGGDGMLALTVRHAGRQFEDDGNTRSLRPATTLDSYLAVPLLPRLALELRAENLFDTRVEAGISGAAIVERATPRTLWLGLRLR